LIISEYEHYSGYQLLHDWQIENGPIAPGHRLMPKLPFVLGGQYSTDNLCSIPALECMILRARIATQIRNLPDASEVKIIIE
jgi:hypothetical protein